MKMRTEEVKHCRTCEYCCKEGCDRVCDESYSGWILVKLEQSKTVTIRKGKLKRKRDITDREKEAIRNEGKTWFPMPREPGREIR